MSFNIIETTAIATYDYLIDLPRYSLEEKLGDYFRTHQQNKYLSSMGYSCGVSFCEMMLNGKANPIQITNEIRPLQQGSETMIAIETKRLAMIFNIKEILKKPEIAADEFYTISRRLEHIMNFYSYASSNMSAREENFLIDKTIEANSIFYQQVRLF
jgi:hypothetical protein